MLIALLLIVVVAAIGFGIFCLGDKYPICENIGGFVMVGAIIAALLLGCVFLIWLICHIPVSLLLAVLIAVILFTRK